MWTNTFRFHFSKLDLENALQAFFKYYLENAIQIKNVSGRKKNKNVSAALVLIVTETFLSKLDLENTLQTFFKYVLENVLQTKWHVKH